DTSGNTNTCSQRVVVVHTCFGDLAAVPLTSPRIICEGESVVFDATASSHDRISYKWRFGGQLLPGKTNTTLALPNLHPTHSGNYSVDISRECAATSNGVALIVPPRVGASPASFVASGITIPTKGTALPYPSVITMQCVPGVVTRVAVTLVAYNHASP